MSGASHTRGPWVANSQHSGACVWRVEVESEAWTNDGYIVADLWGPDDKANARLIAAAPDLLEALERLEQTTVAALRAGDWKVDGACDPDRDLIAARAAIAKAVAAQPTTEPVGIPEGDEP